MVCSAFHFIKAVVTMLLFSVKDLFHHSGARVKTGLGYLQRESGALN